MAGAPTFSCPPDCGWCCTHLRREPDPAEGEFREALREIGVYHCDDHAGVGLALSHEEAAVLAAEARTRGIDVGLHPRTFLLETRRRLVVPVDWHLPHESCPFYADYACTVYAKRPLVCRAFPVLVGAPKWRLAPQCPLTQPVLASGTRLGSVLRAENAARRALEAAHVHLDALASRLLEAPHLRFATGLASGEASARAARYRIVAPEPLLEG